MIALALALAMQVGSYDLVVRFPNNNMGYNRAYRSLAACQRARAAIIGEYVASVERERRALRGTNVTMLTPPDGPFAVCVPR